MTPASLPAVKRRKGNLLSGGSIRAVAFFAPGRFNQTSGQHPADDFPVDISETEVAALEAERQPGVLEAQQVQDGGVDVVDVTTVLDGIEAEFVCFAEGAAGLHAA